MGQDVEEGRLVGGRYRLGGVLGRGGMGTVWRGTDETLGRAVAVKELRLPSSVDEDEKQRLITRTRREAKAIARIRSDSAVTVFDVVDEDDRPWIVMELVEGGSLADRIRKEGPLTPRRTAEVGIAILDVLRAAHREGILHRDVKPSNVLLEEGTDRVVLTDFGIAKVEGDPSITSTGMLVGAPSYISPERARGKPPGPPADLWSLGGLLYAAVEGRPPYDKGSALSTLTAVMTEPVPPPQKAGELADVLYGLLEKDPEMRLDVDGAHAMLDAVASGAAAVPEVPDATRTVALPPVPDEDDATGDTTGDAKSPATAPWSPWSRGITTGRGSTRSGGGTRSGERLLGALKSVRNAAAADAAKDAPKDPAKDLAKDTAAPKAAPKEPTEAEDGTGRPSKATAGAGTAVASGTDGPAQARPGAGLVTSLKGAATKRVLVAVGAIVAVLVVIGAVIANGDDGGGNGSGTGDGGNSAGEKPGKKDEGTGDGTSGKGDGGDEQPADPTPSEDDKQDDEQGDSGGDDGGEQDGGGLPEGYATVESSRFHFSVAMPEGFEMYDIAGTNSGGRYAGPDRGYPRIQVDYTSSPGNDAVAAWKAGEKAYQGNGYERISIEPVEDWRPYPTVADWTFEYETNDGTRLRAVNRGFKVDDGQGHAILVTCKADAWDGKACKTLRETAFETFKPR